MAKTERGQYAPDVLNSFKAPGYTFLQSPLHVKQGAIQWFFGGPGISTIGDSDIEDDETGVFVDGHNFGVTQGTGKVELADGPVYASANKIQQTVTAWSDWRITITVDLGSQSPGVKYYFVTDGNGTVSQPKTCWVHRATAIKLSLSADISAGAVDATTNRLTAPTGTFEPGDRSDDTNPLPSTAFDASEFTEDEFSYIIATGAINGASYEFRMVEVQDDNTIVPYNAYSVTPQITIGSSPVAGSVTFHAPLVARVTPNKIGLSSVRALAPTVGRPTGAKIGLGTTRIAVPIIGRHTGSKIGLGTTRVIEPIIFLATGAPVSNLVQGNVRALLAIIGRVTGTKLASGSVVFEDQVAFRATQTKIGLGSARVIVPIVGRDTGIKIALSTASFQTSIVGRYTGTKTAQTSIAFMVDTIGRFSGTKTLAQGTARFIIDNVLRATGSKTALGGTTRATTSIILLTTGSSSNAVQGNVRALVPIIIRVSGIKLASGNLSAPVNVITRATGSKLASGSSTFFVDNVVRPIGRKIASGLSQFEVPIIGRGIGIKTVNGSSRFIMPNHLRAIGTKFAQGSVRGLVTIWFYSTNIVGDLVIVQVSIRVEDLARLRIHPNDGLVVTELPDPLIRINHDQYRSVGVIKPTEVKSV